MITIILTTISIPLAPAAAATTNLYTTLGIPKTASASEIKKAYRKAALKYHPDKVPESQRSNAEHKFKEVAKAYEWLGDETKRKLYDRYGERSLDPNFNPGMFDAMGGAGGGGGVPPWAQSSGGGTQTFHFGNGGFPGGSGGMGGMFGGGMPQQGGMGGGGGGDFASIDLNEILRQMMGGVGGMDPTRGSSGSSSSSSSHHGMGNAFGNMFGSGGLGQQQQRAQSQQSQQSSSQRTSQKEYTKPVYCSLEDLSNGCTKKLKVSYPSSSIGSKMYTIHIKPGWKEGTKIKYPSSTSINPQSGIQVTYPPITFIIREKSHPFLVHDGNSNLIWKCKLTSRQAERGAKLKLPLPDGTILDIESRSGVISGESMRVQGRGMPVKSSKGDGGMSRGDVLIEFIVVE